MLTKMELLEKCDIKSAFLVKKSLKHYTLYLYKDRDGYLGKIDKFDNERHLEETYFVSYRKLFGRKLGGVVFIPHYNDNLLPPQKTLEKVWGMFIKQARQKGFITEV